jgi:hypothetical protein
MLGRATVLGRAQEGEKREGGEEGLGWAGKGRGMERKRKRDKEREREREMGRVVVIFQWGATKPTPLKENLVLEIRKDWRTTEGTMQ